MRKLASSIALMIVAAGLAPAGASAAARIPSLVPSWALPSMRLGPVPASSTVEIELVLPWRDPAGAQGLARDVSNPASPRYGHFLTPEQFRARFSPALQTVEAARTWLRSKGLVLGAVPANRIVVPARGPASAVARAFGVTLSRYRVGSLALRATDRAPSLPAWMAHMGVLVRGLSDTASLITAGEPVAPSLFEDPSAVAADPPPNVPEIPASPADADPPSAVVYAPPCVAYDGAKTDAKAPLLYNKKPAIVTCSTPPAALRAAYGIDSALKRGNDGSGQTIVMTGSHELRHLPDDLKEWSSRHGIPALKDGQFHQFSYPGAYETPADPTGSVLRPQVWAAQSAMIFETMRTIAPGANYLYVGSTSSFDLQNATLLAVDQHWGDVVMNGWYSADEAQVLPSDTAQIDRIATQAATTGITVMWASGDLGDNAKFNATETGEQSSVSDPLGLETVPLPVTVQNISVYPGHASVSFPAHNPMVTAVGATSLLVGPHGAYLGELGWAKSTRTLLDGGKWSPRINGSYRGSGGGTSVIYHEPNYQQAVVPDDLSYNQDGVDGRVVPDIAVNGDAETGLSIGYTQLFDDGSVTGKAAYSERRANADTAATGLFAAIVALANQRAGHDFGFVNPLLYTLAHSKPLAFRDITLDGRRKMVVRRDYKHPGDPSKGVNTLLKTFEEFGTNRPREGYDTCTGLGSPSRSFLAALAGK